jgi:hypothetical protein
MRRSPRLPLIHARNLPQADKLSMAGLCLPENSSLVFPTFTWMYHRGLGALSHDAAMHHAGRRLLTMHAASPYWSIHPEA